MDQGGDSGGGDDWSNSGCILQREPADLLMEGVRERVESGWGQGIWPECPELCHHHALLWECCRGGWVWGESVLDNVGLRCLLSIQVEVSSKQTDIQVWNLVVKSRPEIEIWESLATQ